MSDRPATASALAPPTASEGWPRRKLLFAIAFALVLHVALIVLFGTQKPMVPRSVTNAPHWQLADNANELIALDDPTLFARPNAHDLVTAFWNRAPTVPPPDFHWTEPPRYLPPAPELFGAGFREFIATNPPVDPPLNFKPEPKFSAPVIAFADALPLATTLKISGDLAQRRWLNPRALPSLPHNDVLAPSVVQALVDSAGNVASAVLLKSSTLTAADQLALQLVCNLRFAPAPRLTFGDISFQWHTVPTNAP